MTPTLRRIPETAPRSWLVLGCLAGMVICDLSAPMIARAADDEAVAILPPAPLERTDCLVLPREPIEVELPAGSNEIEKVVPMVWDERFLRDGHLDTGNRPSCNADPANGFWARDSRHPFTDLFPIELKTDGRGLFEATIVLTEEDARLEFRSADWTGVEPDPEFMDEQTPTVFLATLPAVSFDAQQPDSADHPEWRYRRQFVGTREQVRMGATWPREVAFDTDPGPTHLGTVREMELRIRLRRLTDRCYMHATVTGGPGAGTYSGDVAVLGNPTGVSDEMLDMWFGTEEGERLDAFEDAWGSQAGAQMREQMTEEQAAQLQALYRQMGSAAEAADPVREVREMLTLTLEDVRFDALPPGTPMEAIAKMVGHFVLAAQLAGDESVGFDLLVGAFELPVESVGVKGPGLGLASTKSNCGAPSLPPSLYVGPCAGDLPTALDLDALGAVCGAVNAKVFNEQCQEITVRADFLAGRNIEQCMR